MNAFGSAVEPEVERRTSRRFSLCIPVLAKHPTGEEIWAPTRNISSSGISFYASNGFTIGCALELVLTLPPEGPATEPVRITCYGRVVRIEKRGASATAAISAQIDNCKFSIPSEGCWSTLQTERYTA